MRNKIKSYKELVKQAIVSTTNRRYFKILEINKIYNMDCLEGMKEIDDGSIDMILTDIPYGGHVTTNGAERSKYGGQMRNMNKGAADILTFDLRDFLKECHRITRGSIYIFCGIEQVSDVFSFFKQKPDVMTRRCLWRKTNPSPQNGQHMWLAGTEDCIFVKKRKTLFNRKCASSVWDFPVGRGKIHPTEKPLKLFEYLVESSSKEKDIIFDPCIGSGTTAIAAMLTKRNFIGFELDKGYYDIASKRIEEHRKQGVNND